MEISLVSAMLALVGDDLYPRVKVDRQMEVRETRRHEAYSYPELRRGSLAAVLRELPSSSEGHECCSMPFTGLLLQVELVPLFFRHQLLVLEYTVGPSSET